MSSAAAPLPLCAILSLHQFYESSSTTTLISSSCQKPCFEELVVLSVHQLRHDKRHVSASKELRSLFEVCKTQCLPRVGANTIVEWADTAAPFAALNGRVDLPLCPALALRFGEHYSTLRLKLHRTVREFCDSYNVLNQDRCMRIVKCIKDKA